MSDRGPRMELDLKKQAGGCRDHPLEPGPRLKLEPLCGAESWMDYQVGCVHTSVACGPL